MWVIEHKGHIDSLNQWYSSKHWTRRKSEKDRLALIFTAYIINAKIPPLSQVELKVEYNSRLDVDNAIVGAKVIMDCLKKRVIKEDNSKHYKRLTIEHNEKLEKDTYIFTIKEWER